MATTNDWMDFDPPTAAERLVEAAYFAQLDAAESYAAYIEQLAADDDGLDDEPNDDGDEGSPDMATTMIPQERTATPARWQQALERAIANGVEAFRIAGTGEFVITSATKLDTVYRTDGVACECEAAMLGGDSVCQHRAVVRSIIGWLPEPEPPVPAAPAVVACRDCGGNGYLRIYTGSRLADWWPVPCRACDGTGNVPGGEALAA